MDLKKVENYQAGLQIMVASSKSTRVHFKLEIILFDIKLFKFLTNHSFSILECV
jgi:hypothetical protein